MTTVPPQPADHDIREKLAAKEYRVAFEHLLERYKERVFRLALSIVRNETQAEDMTQEIFLRIWKALPGYQGQASLSTWIYAISRNRCLTDLRKQKTHPTISLNDPETEPHLEKYAATPSTASETDAVLDVQSMLTRLPDKYRQVITLFYLEQKSYEDVAAMLAIPVGTVKTFLHRGKKELLAIMSRQTSNPGKGAPEVLTRDAFGN